MPRPMNSPDFKVVNKKPKPAKLFTPRRKDTLYIVGFTKLEFEGLLHWLANVPTYRTEIAKNAIQKICDACKVEV